MHLKTLLAAGVGITVLALAGFYFSERGAGTGAASDDSPPGAETVLMVDELRDGAEGASGEVEVRGVVGGTNTERQLFGLIDSREVEACGGISCPEFMLPVEWAGELPAPGETVSVRGQVKTTDQGLLLAASEVNAR
jgi:hypothetical protein